MTLKNLKNTEWTITFLILASVLAAFGAERLSYPPAHRTDHVDEYHGTKVADPYRWMEHDDDSQLKSWIEAENKLTFGYLAGIPERDGLRKRLAELSDFVHHPSYARSYAGAPIRKGALFFQRQDERQNQPALYVQQPGESPSGDPYHSGWRRG